MTGTDRMALTALRGAPALEPTGPGPDLIDVVRGGAARRARAARQCAAAATSAVTALLVGGVVVGAALIGDGAAIPVSGRQDAAADRLALLGDPAGPEDVLSDAPEVAQLDVTMDPATVRQVAYLDGVTVLAGSTPAGEVCVLTHTRPPGAATTSCLPPAQFESDGLGFSFLQDQILVAGLLLPDSWALDGTDQRLTDVTGPGSGVGLEDLVAPNLLLRVTDASEPATAGPTAADELALLERPATVADLLPTTWTDGSEVVDPGVVLSSTRLVASGEGAAYFAGTDDEGQVCVLVHRLASDTVGSSCTAVTRFADVGVWVSVGGAGGGETTGMLLPDVIDSTDLDSIPAWTQPGVDPAFGPEDVLAPNLLGRTSNP